MVDQETTEAMAKLGFKPLGSHLWSRITSEGCVAHIASINPNRGWHCVLHGKGATVHTPPIASCGPIEDPIAAATWLLIESANHG